MAEPTFGLWTPAARRDQATRVNLAVTSMIQSVNQARSRILATGASGEQFWNDWSQFKQSWQQFYGPAMAGSGAWDLTQAALRQWTDRYNSLERRFAQATGVQPVATTEDTRSSSSATPYLMVGAGVVALIALAVIGTSIASTLRPVTSALSRNRRRRRR